MLNGKKIGDREIRVKKCLGSVEAIQKQKLMDAMMNGRKKGKKQMKKPMKKIVVNEAAKERKEGKEKKEKKEKQAKKQKNEKKEKVDLSFMGNRTKLSMNAINANKRLMKKMKK